MVLEHHETLSEIREQFRRQLDMEIRRGWLVEMEIACEGFQSIFKRR